MPLVIVIALIILISLYLALYEKDAAFRDNPIGKRQFNLLKVYLKAESILFYIEQSAKYALQQAIYDLAQSGGISEIEFSDAEIFAGYSCGRYNDNYVWYELSKDQDGKYLDYSCFDEKSLDTHLIYYLNKNLNEYLQVHPSNILLNNYNYEVRGNLEIIGKAIEPLKLDIKKQEIPEEIRTTDLLREPVKIVKESETTIEGLKDFTGTPLCAKGSQCILTDEALKLLIKAQERAAQKGLTLEVYSAYRSYYKQKALWEGRTPERYAYRYENPAVRKKYVSDPDECGNNCPHFTAKVVDVKLRGKTTGMMTSNDWLLLHKIMTEAGWVRYANEPWHFECCGTDRYARAKQQGVDIIA